MFAESDDTYGVSPMVEDGVDVQGSFPLSGIDLAAEGPEEASDEVKLEVLLLWVDKITDPKTRLTEKKDVFERLSIQIHPRQLPAELKHIFVHRCIERDLLHTTVSLIELEHPELTVAACNFLGDFCFNSDTGSQAVLLIFDRIKMCFTRMFLSHSVERLVLLSSAVSLCANIVATCPGGHKQVISLVKSVFLPTMRDPNVPDRLLGNTILLLANLSLTLSSELRTLRVADVLLDLVTDRVVSVTRKSVAESVIIFLLGDHECEEIDRLMASNVIEGYCMPIMAHALSGQEFRGMYPHLVYSSRLFEVLAKSRTYAQALVAHETVIPLLIQASKRQDIQTQLESNNEGRRLAVEALRSFARFKLFPVSDMDKNIMQKHLQDLLVDDHVGVRRSAAGLSAFLNPSWTYLVLLLGLRLEWRCLVPPEIWRENVMPFLFPLPEKSIPMELTEVTDS